MKPVNYQGQITRKISYSFATLSKSRSFKGEHHGSSRHDSYTKGPKKDYFVKRPKEALQKEKVTKQRQKVMEHQQVL